METAETQASLPWRSGLRDPKMGLVQRGSGWVPRRGFLPTDDPSCGRDVSYMGVKDGPMGFVGGAPPANTFWVQAKGSKRMGGTLD